MEKITSLAFPSLQFTMKILKLSITLLDKLGHIQVKHADIYNMEKFQEFNARGIRKLNWEDTQVCRSGNRVEERKTA